MGESVNLLSRARWDRVKWARAVIGHISLSEEADDKVSLSATESSRLPPRSLYRVGTYWVSVAIGA